MTDLTPIFNQCVAIVRKELNASVPPQHRADGKGTTLSIEDTFSKECLEYYHHLVELNAILTDIKVPYVAAGGTSAKNVLSLEDKNRIDEEMSYRIQLMYEKLKVLQNYEKKRQAVTKPSKSHWLGAVFGGEEQEKRDIFVATVNFHRTQMLKSLNEATNHVGKRFELMQRQRLQREKRLNLLNFQNLGDDLDFYHDNKPLHGVAGRLHETLHDSLNNSTDDLNVVELEQEEKTANGFEQVLEKPLSQEQQQQYEKENQAFLALKSNQLKQVEKLQHSMVDIINLQAELSFQLDAQSEQVSSMLDTQNQVNLDLRQGNQNLTKATGRNKKGANFIIATCLVLGFLLLLLDFITW